MLRQQLAAYDRPLDQVRSTLDAMEKRLNLLKKGPIEANPQKKQEGLRLVDRVCNLACKCSYLTIKFCAELESVDKHISDRMIHWRSLPQPRELGNAGLGELLVP